MCVRCADTYVEHPDGDGVVCEYRGANKACDYCASSNRKNCRPVGFPLFLSCGYRAHSVKVPPRFANALARVQRNAYLLAEDGDDAAVTREEARQEAQRLKDRIARSPESQAIRVQDAKQVLARAGVAAGGDTGGAAIAAALQDLAAVGRALVDSYNRVVSSDLPYGCLMLIACLRMGRKPSSGPSTSRMVLRKMMVSIL